MADTRITDAEIAGHMGWRGPGAYTEASLRKIQGIVEHVLRAERASQPKLPANAAEMIAFIGSHYHFMRDMADPNDTVYELTAHDLLSAFRWWFDEFELEDEPPQAGDKDGV